MTRRLYAYAFFEDFILVYPVYALLFAAHGLSPGEISTLLVIWSVTAFVVEIPSGVWADTFSRRRLLALSPLVVGAGFALWTFAPSYPAFALGFVLWGAGGAMRSGTFQALAYEELARVGAKGSYARVMGRTQVASTLAVTCASMLAAPVLAAGGYLALGVASVAATAVTALLGLSLPGHDRPEAGETDAGPDEEDDEPSMRAVLRTGLAQIRHVPAVRQAVILLAAVWGFTSIDEYLPLLAQDTGVSVPQAALLVAAITVAESVGGWLAGRGAALVRPLLVLAALSLAAGALTRQPWGFALVAVAFGIFAWAHVAAEARLQEHVDDRVRATVTSVSGLGTEVVVLLVYGSYGLGSAWLASWQLFVLAAVPYLVIAAAMGVRGAGGGRR
ncbi:MFS transporter [Nonomuraea sp. NBC_01738]|uniref:MFS transporter n=1 Tax=Nonomuraea sp. NBC_01738 TaxID=2976003 RepID=UPI002E14D053|nr:MFS transporter [Nonomuraea sp. NBC_01738]